MVGEVLRYASWVRVRVRGIYTVGVEGCSFFVVCYVELCCVGIGIDTYFYVISILSLYHIFISLSLSLSPYF